MANSEVNPSIWAACAGIINMEPLEGCVYYFPQGHVENYSNSPSVRTLCSELQMIKCNLVSVKYLADPVTDEVFAHFVLNPLPSVDLLSESPIQQAAVVPDHQIPLLGCIKVFDSCDFTECLINEASSGVDQVFPKQDMSLSIQDIHKRVWTIHHSYNSTLECHKLSKGWEEFVTTKKLSPGDSLVFLKSREGELTVGIRRDTVPGSIDWDSPFHYPLGVYESVRKKFKRIGTGLMSVQELSQALGKAQGKIQFEVDYYPSVGSSDFVVSEKRVCDSKERKWEVGMRVKKIGLGKDHMRKVCHEGTVTSLRRYLTRWTGSIWRNLQVQWDDTCGKMEKATNFWEVEPVTATVSDMDSLRLLKNLARKPIQPESESSF